MSPGPRLVLKQSTGWFAAGWGLAEAMTMYLLPKMEL